MDIIVGNWLRIFFVGFLVCTVYVQATIKVRLTDMQGKEIKQVSVGYPCKIQVIIDDASGAMQHPHIPGLEQVTVRGQETRMNIVNGHRSLHYGYNITFDKPGTYALGPVELEREGELISSNVLSIQVSRNSTPVSSSSTDYDAQDKPVFVRLVTNTTKAFVGEKIMCALELYYAFDDLKLQKILEPEFKDVNVASRKGHFSRGTKNIDGISYSCIEWQWELYPEKAGEITIPAFGIDYAKPVDQEQVFDFFWGPRYTPARIYSNALTLTIEPLPPHEKKITALGEFKHFTASIKPATAQEGEGMVLTLCIEGEGDLQNLSLEPLSGIPSQLTWYDSKQYIDESNPGLRKKCFEYIIQGMEAGQWNIPAQELIYFDVKKRKYKTLKTNSVQVTITPRKQSHDVPIDQTLEQNAEQNGEEELCPLSSDQAWYKNTEKYIPWWMFFCVVFIISLSGLIIKFYDILKNKKRSHRSRSQLFAQARSGLQDAAKKGNANRIYSIFVTLFASLLQVPEGQLSEDMIVDALQKTGMVHDEQEEWKQFFNDCAAILFSEHTPLQHTLFKQAHRWLDIFEKTL